MTFFKAKLSLLAFGLGAFAGAQLASAQTFTVPVAATSSRTMPYSGWVETQAVAADASGNIFFTRPASGIFAEQPANGTEITLISGSLSYPKGVAVDVSGYAYVTDYSGHLWKVPVGGGTATDILPACNTLDGYYLGTQVVAVDGLGNVYTAGNNMTALFKITSSGTCSIVSGITLDASSHIASDAAGDLAYSVGTALYSLPATSTTPVAVAATFDAINGLRSDDSGNVFVTTGSTVKEVPFINGALDGSKAFAVLPFSSTSDIGVDSRGKLYTSDSANLYINTPGSIRFSSTVVGTASATQTVNVIFNSAQTLAGLRYVSGTGTSTEIANTGTGTCATGSTYAQGASCTIDLAVTPAGIGARNGAVLLSSASTLIGTAMVAGQGTGGGLVGDPGTQSTLGTNWSVPNGVAVGASGEILVADKASGTLSYIASGSGTPVVIASGLVQPAGTAFGPDGTAYVVNAGANTIVAVPYTGTAYGVSATVVAGLNAPTAIAVAANGDLYVADTGAGAVLRIPNQAGSLNPLNKIVVGSGFQAPSGLALDVSGNLIVSDKTTGSITKIVGGSSTVIATGLTSPGTLAVDDSGTLYVLQSGVASVLRIPYVNNAYNTNGTTSIGSSLVSPVSLAADAAGNLFVADASVPAVVRIQRTAATLDLGRVNLSSSSASQSIVFSNSGDATLTFNSPMYAASGNTTDFDISTSGSNGCSSGYLSAGNSCSIAATFTPIASGTRTEVLTLNTTAANASSITATFTGTGINLPKTTLVLTLVSPTGSVSYGQSVTVSASITPAIGATGAPTGTVQFFVNGVAYGSAVALASNSASIVISNLPAGSNTINATYSGDNNFGGSTGTALSVPVSLATTATTLTSTVSSTTPVPPGTSVTLAATISSSVTSTKPTGTVTFTNGTNVLGTATLNTAGVATLITTSLPNGTYSIVANYGGDSGFAASSSNSVSVAILAAQYVLSNLPASLTVSAPGSVSTTFTVTPISGYTGGVDMVCSGLPANTKCSFTPGAIYFINSTNSSGATIAPAAQTVTLTLTTDSAPATTVAAWLLPVGGFLLFGLLRSRRKFQISSVALCCIIGLMSLLAVTSLCGCGSSNNFNTPTGASTVTVTMTGSASGTSTVPTDGTGNTVKTFTFTLNVI